MSPSASSEPVPPPDEQRRRGRRVALVILALCAAPTIAAWFAYFVWQPQSRTNYGQLIEPRSLSDPELRRLDGGSFRLSQLRGKWVLLQVDSADCGDSCRKKLVYMRQARLALGKDAERIERVWLLDDAAVPAPALLREHEGLNAVRVSGGSLLEELPASGNPAGYIFVIDPLGSLMLRFPGDPDARRMLRDLARLLRASRIG
jgi:ferric-dicitrate binding protein FerR (iron transport regulator)